MNLLVIACSLSSQSRSAVLAEQLVGRWRAAGGDARLFDLRAHPLPLCDAADAYADPRTAELVAALLAADAVVLAVPIYNYDVGGAARNVLALGGRAWDDKPVGLIAAAGGERSYMSLMPLANSLMLDFRCVILPRFVYASAGSFHERELVDPEIDARLERFARELRRLAGALAAVPAGAG